jgi:hypothetical protein
MLGTIATGAAGVEMTKILTVKTWIVLAAYVFADVVCVGMGMGVPIFCIGFGFLVGWYVAARAVRSASDVSQALAGILAQAVVTSAVTFALMAVLWGSVTGMLFDPAADFVNFGIPMILYDPRASFVGWLVLMIFISPFLQLLTTLFSSYLVLLVSVKRAAWGSSPSN